MHIWVHLYLRAELVFFKIAISISLFVHTTELEDRHKQDLKPLKQC